MCAREATLDRIPPQSIEAETCVLGAMLLDKDAIAQAIETISQDSFYKEANAKIYQAIIGLYDSNQPVDIVSLTEYLRQRKELEAVGGAAYVSMLIEAIPSAAHIDINR